MLAGELYDPLPEFPVELLACKNLVELEIFRGIVDGTIPKELGALSKLTSLSLGGLDTKKLPEELGGLARLESLELSYVGSLAALPESIRYVEGTESQTAVQQVLGDDPAHRQSVTLDSAPPAMQQPSMGCSIKWKPGNAPAYF